MPWHSNNSGNAPRGQDPPDLDDFRSQESPHVYLLSPSDGTGQISGANDSFMESSRELLDKKEGELVSLRHRLQCLEKYKHDLMDEVKQLQDDNETLTRKLEDREKGSKEKERECKSLHCSMHQVWPSSGTPVESVAVLDSRYSELQEEFRKIKLALIQSEDKCFVMLQKLEEAKDNIRRKETSVKELQEANGIMQKEISHNLNTKQALQTKLEEKDSLIETLETHCAQLSEQVSYLSKDNSGSKNFNGVGKYCYPNLSLSLNNSANFSMMEEPVDLGHEVIDVQWRETKDILEKTEERLKICEKIVQTNENVIQELTDKLHNSEKAAAIQESSFIKLKDSEQSLLKESEKKAKVVEKLTLQLEHVNLELFNLKRQYEDAEQENIANMEEVKIALVRKEKDYISCKESLQNVQKSLNERTHELEEARSRLSEMDTEAKKQEFDLCEANKVSDFVKAQNVQLEHQMTIEIIAREESEQSLFKEREEKLKVVAELTLQLEHASLELFDLKKEYQVAKQESDATIEEAKIALVHKEEEYLSCKDSLQNVQKGFEEQTRELEAARSRLNEMYDEMNILNVRIQGLDSQFCEACEVRDFVKSQNVKLEHQITEEIKIREEAEQSLLAEREESVKIVSELTLQLDRVNVKLFDLEKEYETSRRENAATIEGVQIALVQKEEEYLSCKESLQTAQKSLEERTCELEAARSRLSAMDTEAKKQEFDLCEANKVSDFVKAQNVQLEHQMTIEIKAREESEQSLFKEREEKLKVVAELTLQLEHASLELFDLKKEYQVAKQESDATIEEAKIALVHKEEEYLSCKDSLQNVQKGFEEQTRELEAARSRLNEMYDEMNILNVRIQGLDSQFCEACEVRDFVKSQNVKLEHQITEEIKIREEAEQSLLAERVESVKIVSELTLQLDRVNVKLFDLEKEYETSRRENAATIEGVQIALVQKEEEYLSCKESLQTAQKSLEERTCELEAARSRLSAMDTEAKKQEFDLCEANKVSDFVKAQNVQLEHQMTIEIKAREESEQSLFKEREEKLKVVAELTLQLEHASLELFDLKKEYQVAKQESDATIEEAKIALVHKEEEYLSCKDSLQNVQKGFEEQTRELEAARSRLNEMYDEMNILNVRIQGLDSQFCEACDVRDFVKSQNVKLEHQIIEEIKIRQEAEQSLLAEREESVKIVSELTLQLDRVNVKLFDLEKEYETSRRENAATIEGVQIALVQKEEEYLSCKESLQTAQKSLEERTCELEAARSRLSAMDTEAKKQEFDLCEANKVSDFVKAQNVQLEHQMTIEIKAREESEQSLFKEREEKLKVVAELTLQLEHASLELFDLKKEYQVAKQESDATIEEAKIALVHKEEEYLSCKDSLQNVQKGFKEQTRELEAARSRLNEMYDEMNILNVRIQGLDSQFCEACEVRDFVKSQNVKVEHQITEEIKIREEAEQSLLAERVESVKIVSELTLQLDRVNVKLFDLEKEYETSRRENAATIEGVQIALVQKEEEYLSCKESLQTAQKSLEERTCELEAARSRLSAMDTEAKKQEFDLCEANKVSDFVKAQNVQLEHQMTIEIKAREESEQSLFKEREEKLKVVAELTLQLEHASLELFDLKKEYQVAKQESDATIEEAKIALVHKEEEYLSCKDSLQNVQKGFKEQTRELEAARSRLNEMYDEMNILNVRIQGLDSQFCKACEVRDFVKSQNVKLEHQIIEEIKIREEAEQSLLAEREESVKIVSELTLQLDRVNVKLFDLEKEYETSRRENAATIEGVQIALVQKEEEYLSCKESLQTAQKSLEERTCELEAARSRVFEVDSELKMLNLRIQKLEFQLGEVCKVSDFVKAQNVELEHQMIVKVKEARETGMLEVKEKYSARCEKYKSDVAVLLEGETSKSSKLKRQLDEAISRAEAAEEQADQVKREMGQLRRDYLESQNVIHVMQTSVEKQQQKIRKLEDGSSKHAFAAPVYMGSANLHQSHQLSDSSLLAKPKIMSSTLVSSRSVGNFNSTFRKSPEEDMSDRRLSSISITSNSSNTSNSSGRFKAVPTGSGSLFKCEDEEEFQFQEKNIFDLKNKRQIGSVQLPGVESWSSLDLDERSDCDRFSELYRRNTMVPPHMKSCYPSEYITCDDGEVDENKLKQLPRSVSGPVTSRIKESSVIHAGAPSLSSSALSSVRENKKSAPGNNISRKPFRTLQHP